MAAHDDKISDNRRRLFKALSAAPVVYTVDSGAQQAMGSVYQCAAKVREESIPRFLNINNSTSLTCEVDVETGLEICTVNGVIYQKVLWWRKEDLPAGVAGTLGVPCQTVWNNLPTRIIQLNGQLVQGSSDPVPFPPNGSVTVVENAADPATDGTLEIYQEAAQTNSCFSLPFREGLVSYVGRTSDADDDWEPLGFFPQYRIQNGINGTDPGDLQGMTRSCLTSFMEDGAIGLND